MGIKHVGDKYMMILYFFSIYKYVKYRKVKKKIEKGWSELTIKLLNIDIPM